MTRQTSLMCIAILGLVAAGCGGGAGSPSAAPSPVVAGSAVNLAITAKDIAFTPASMSAPAGSPLEIRFDNQDAGVPHNLGLYGDAGFTTKLFESEIKTGPAVEQLSIRGLIPGTYQFRCSVHPNMTAELKVGG